MTFQLKPRDFHPPIPLTNVALILPYTCLLESMGAPVERLLARSGIPVGLLQHPAATVPLQNAFRFGELACRTQGTEYLGLHVGLANSLDDYGSYGQILKRSLTIHEYLRKGIALYNTLITGQRCWLSEHGKVLRFNVATVGEPGLGSYQSHLETLVVTIATLRGAAGRDWSPAEISLAYKSREPPPEIDLFTGSRISRGTGETYFTIPRTMMQRRFTAVNSDIPTTNRGSPAEHPLPEDMGGLVQVQIEALLSDRTLHVDTVAESLAMSRRGLQRSLAEQGLTYSQLLTDIRVRKAAVWLENTDKTIAEIAFELGYRDASNFTRAFRRQTGVPPQAFRGNARKT